MLKYFPQLWFLPQAVTNGISLLGGEVAHKIEASVTKVSAMLSHHDEWSFLSSKHRGPGTPDLSLGCLGFIS